MRLKKIKEKLTCPLVSALIQVFVLYIAFFQMFNLKNHYEFAIVNRDIKEKIEEKINYCGKDTWLSWIILDANKTKNRYYFQDVIGCKNTIKKDESCAFSVKEAKLNSFYNQKYHTLDTNTLYFLEKLDTGMVGYYEDLDFLKSFSSIKEALNSTNKDIKSLGISVTKNTKSNIVYIFLMTNTNRNESKCDRKETVNILEELSYYAEDRL